MAGFDTSIPDPKVGMEIIMEAMSKLNFDLFQYALQYKNYDENKLTKMIEEVSEYRKKLEKEHERLLDFSKTFNKSFVTDNNRCFDTGLKLLRKLRSGISEVKKIYKKFCPRWSKRYSSYLAKTNKRPSAYEYSYFNEKEFQLSFWGLEDAPTCVQELYKEISNFFFQLNLSMSLCMQVIRDEEAIRKDPQYCNFLYNQFKEEVMIGYADMIMLISPDSVFLSAENNPAIASLTRYSNPEAWASHGFHNYSKTEVKHLVIKQALEDKKNKNLNIKETALFGDDIQMIEKIKGIIFHFDELLPEDYKRKKIEAKYIVWFMKWGGIADNKTELFVSYFKEQYFKNKKHHYEVVGKNAVSSARRTLLVEDWNDEQYKIFAQKVNEMKTIQSIPTKIAQ